MPTPSKACDSVTEAVSDLGRRGYTMYQQPDAEKDCLACNAPFAGLSPGMFRIDEVHRFEDMTDPGDEMSVFAIALRDGKIKNVVVNAYGIYTSYRSSRLVDHLSAYLKLNIA